MKIDTKNIEIKINMSLENYIREYLRSKGEYKIALEGAIAALLSLISSKELEKFLEEKEGYCLEWLMTKILDQMNR